MRNVLRTSALAAAFGLAMAASPAAAFDKADWLVRGRIVNFQPGDGSSSFVTMPGTGLQFDSDTSLEFDFSFFPLRHLGLEMSNTVTSQALEATGTGKSMGELADSRSLSSSFTIQWHPLPDKTVRPYFGVGANYTTFFSENSRAAMELAMGGPTTVRLDDSVGLVGQLGMDIMFMKNWCVNLDAKYVTADTVARFGSATTAEQVRVDADPWVFSTGFGYSF